MAMIRQRNLPKYVSSILIVPTAKLVLVDELRSSEQRKHVEPIVQAVEDLHFSAGFVKKQVFLWDHEHFY